MLSAIEEFMRLHPASYFGRSKPLERNSEAFEELEVRHLRVPHEHPERREPTWMIGEVAAAAAMLVVFFGILTVIARLAGDSPNATQQPALAVSETATYD